MRLPCLIFLALVAQVNAQVPKQPIPLWPDGAPGALGTNEEDKPSLLFYPASNPGQSGTAVIVCPGGGYSRLSMESEGTPIAAWLNNLGISAFILKYRLGPKYHYPAQFLDVQRAIRYVRAHAAALEIHTDHIGIWGFSAGGHLAATAATHFENTSTDTDVVGLQSARPDFLILSYPVISMSGPFVNAGTRKSLLGENPSPEILELLSAELHVTDETPPTFLFHTSEDPVVPVENSVNFYLALRKARVPVEMHIYQKGRHGVGLAPSDAILGTWPDHLAAWLQLQGFR